MTFLFVNRNFLPLFHGGSSDSAEEAAIKLKYQWPIQSKYVITTQFGGIDAHHPRNNQTGCVNRGHGGVDIAVPEGTAVYAARDGDVLYSGKAKGYGNWVVLKHSDGDLTIYGHLASKGLAKVGIKVTAGTQIATVGSKAEGGHTTGPHLHFQINPAGGGVGACNATDPMKNTQR